MSMTISVRIEPTRASDYCQQRSHDLREKTTTPGYVDDDRTILNSPGDIPSLEKIHEANENMKFVARQETEAKFEKAKASGDDDKIKEAKKEKNKCRKSYDRNGVVAYRGILTFGTNARLGVIDKLSSQEQDSLALEAINRVANVLDSTFFGITAHRDEASIHFHFYILATNKFGKKLNPTKPDLRKIQDEAAKPFNKFGISRGKSKEAWIKEGADSSKTIHKSVSELHADLPFELEAAKKELTNIKELARLKQMELDIAKKDLLQAKELLQKEQLDIDRVRTELNTEKENIEGAAKEYETIKLRCDGAEYEVEKLKNILEKAKNIAKNQFKGKEYEVVTKNTILQTVTETRILYTTSDMNDLVNSVAAEAFFEIKEREANVQINEEIINQKEKNLIKEKRDFQVKNAEKEAIQIVRDRALQAFSSAAIELHPNLLSDLDFKSWVEIQIGLGISLAEVKEAVKDTAFEDQICSACLKISEKEAQQDHQEQERYYGPGM